VFKMALQLNPYLPYPAYIRGIRDEVLDKRPIKTFTIELEDEKLMKNFTFKPGQCVMVGIIGIGEAIFAIASPPNADCIEISVMKMGRVTTALHNCNVGDKVFVRGPLGNGFPVEEWEGKNIVLIAGGIGITPLRSLYYYICDNRDKYGELTFIYGARSSKDLCFKEEIFEIEKKEKTCHITIDVEEEGWTRHVGFVPDVLMKVSPSPKNSIAITCGPPIMIRYVIQNLHKLGFKPSQIYTTLEKRMKCGIGKCGRCNIGSLYVCKDGPVFSYETLQKLPEVF